MVLDFGSGWDILIPEGWGMAFWMSLVLIGARPGGLRENKHLQLEMEQLQTPNEYPDTSAGKHFAQEEEERKKEDYFK